MSESLLCILQVCEGALQASLMRLSPLRISLGSTGRFGGGERCRASSGKGFYLKTRRFWVISDTVGRLHGHRDIVWNCGGRGVVCRERVVGFAQTPHASCETVEQVPGVD